MMRAGKDYHVGVVSAIQKDRQALAAKRKKSRTAKSNKSKPTLKRR